MPRIHFSSGKTLEIDEQEFNGISTKLQYKGIRIQVIKSTGDLVPLNSSTIEFIEKADPTFDDIFEDMDEVIITDVESVEEEKRRIIAEEQIVELPKQEERAVRPLTDAEKQDKLLAEMIEKSNCTHGDGKQKMFKQDTKQGIKYFPVCTHCGKRERYVSGKKIKEGVITDWTMEDLANATFYPGN
jgi:hypothetical protein